MIFEPRPTEVQKRRLMDFDSADTERSNVGFGLLYSTRPTTNIGGVQRSQRSSSFLASLFTVRRLTQLTVHVLDALLPTPKEAQHLRTGRRGEELAYFYLRKHKYIIIARNFRTPWHKSELDMVGWNEDVLCFIEVKTRTTRAVAPAEAAVDQEKRDDLRKVARQYLKQVREAHRTRFDIVTVYLDKPKPEITIIKRAFYLNGD